eukprot:PITA_10200
MSLCGRFSGQSLYFSSHSVWFSSWLSRLRRNMSFCGRRDNGPLYRSGIPRIPNGLIDRKPRAYKPHAISLGPLHFGPSQFSDSHFEDHVKKKEQLLLDRFSYGVSHLNTLVASITSKDNLRIRQWYGIRDSETFLEPQKLGRMMALDGIFLLKFLREISLLDYEGSTSSFREQGYALTNQEVLEDILKLQNQIPLFTLKTIIQWEEQKEGEEKEMPPGIIPEARRGTKQDLDIILKEAWHRLSPFVQVEPRIFPGEDAHILGFVYENILGQGTDLTQYGGGGNKKQRLPERAGLLDKKGVKFAACAGPLHKIRFDRIKGTLHLPTIEINEGTDAVMRNLMVFELFGCKGQAKPMKCYVELMDQLINTAEDVEVLSRSGIVNHHLGSDQEVADIWNKMRKGHDPNGKYGPIDSAINEVINFNRSYRRIWRSEKMKIFLVITNILQLLANYFAIPLPLDILQTILQLLHH